MFIDASALVAMMTEEADARMFVSRLGAARERLVSPISRFEATVAVARILVLDPAKAEVEVSDFLNRMSIRTIPVPVEAALIAIDAFARYGKGRGHPAQLNMGDCFAYACAHHVGLPLLFKGDDFAQTDIDAA